VTVRLVRSVGDELQADRPRTLAWPVEPVVERFRHGVAMRAAMTVVLGGAALVFGDVEVSGLATGIGVGVLIWTLISLVQHRRILVPGPVDDAPASLFVPAESPTPTSLTGSLVGDALILLALAAVMALVAQWDETPVVVIGWPLGRAAAGLLIVARTARWERRTGKQLLVRDDDGDLHLYARERPAS
jgi:hypothetical protein